MLVSKALAATAKLSSCSYDTDMLMTVDVSAGTQQQKMSVAITGKTIIDIAKKQMKMVVNMTEGTIGKVTTETYISDGWIYMGGVVSGTKQWFKTELTEDAWTKQWSLSCEFELINVAATLDLLGTEYIDGVPCYAIEVTPGPGALLEWVAHRQSEVISSIDLTKVDLPSLFKKASIKECIAKDSYRFTRLEMDLNMEFPGDAIKGSSFYRMVMEMTGNVSYYDFNEPVSIKLPAEALKAITMPK